MTQQRTLAAPTRARGIGLHSGRSVDMHLLPAAKDTGIVFRRLDMDPVREIPARADLVADTTLSTGLAQAGAAVSTIEHLMSALCGTGIDNCVVALSAPEVPIMDGSAAPFVHLLTAAGIREQDAPKRFLKVRNPVQVSDGDKWARVVPCDGYRLDFAIDFEHPILRSSTQNATVNFSSAAYIRDVSRARTFGFMKEFETLRANNLALGASLDNAVAVDDHRVLNVDGLRYDDEFVRHKILDAVGDLYLLGYPLLGAYAAYKSGHALNNKLVRALLADEKAWEIVSLGPEVPVGSRVYEPLPQTVVR